MKSKTFALAALFSIVLGLGCSSNDSNQSKEATTQNSLASTSAQVCPIVIEDVIMMTPVCLGAGCNCTGNAVTVNGAGTSSQSFNVGAAVELYKVSITCPAEEPAKTKTNWFVIQTEIRAGQLIVNVPSLSDLTNNGANTCANSTDFAKPSKGTGCGRMDGTLPEAYSIDMTLNEAASAGKVEFTLARGCSIAVTKCGGCPQ